MANSGILIYGAGQLGTLFFNLVSSHNLNILGFIDKYSKKSFYHGLPLYNLNSVPKEFLVCTVIVCAFKASSPESISDELVSFGFIKITDAYQYLYELKGCSFYNGWRFGTNRINSKRLSLCSSIISSIQCPISRELYRINMAYRSSSVGNSGFSPLLTEESKKYSNEIVRGFLQTHRPSTFIDGGAWDFVLFTQLLDIGCSTIFDSYIAFDPLPHALNNYIGLQSRIREKFLRFDFFQTALIGKQASPEKCFFNFKMGMASRVVSPFCMHAEPVPTSLLSSYIPQNSSSLVKLHIEGMEFQVLKEFYNYLPHGHRHLIIINCSHTPEGLVDIPYFLVSRGCTIYYRQHAFYGEGLTLYALTPNVI